MRVQELGGEPLGLAPEEEDVIVFERDVTDRGPRPCCEEAQAFFDGSIGWELAIERLQTSVERRVNGEIDEVPIVEPSALQVAVLETETEGFDEMEFRPEAGGQASGATGVVRDLGMDEDDVHGATI